MKTLWEYTLWEIGQMLTVHRRGVLMMVFIPMVYMFLFGGLFSLQTVKHVPIGVVDLDGSAESRALIHGFDDADTVQTAVLTADEMAAQDAMEEGAIYGMAVIPQGFGRSLQIGQPVSVEAVINQGNTILGGGAANGIQAVVATYNAKQIAQNRMVKGQSKEEAMAAASPVTLSMRSLYNTTGGYVDFFAGVLILHAVQIGTVFVLGPMVVLERKRRRAAMAVHPLLAVAAKTIVYGLLQTFVFLLALALAHILFQLTIRGDFFLLFGFSLLFMMVLTSFSVAAGSWVKTPGEAISYTLFYIMPSVLFSGAIWPRASMDPVSLMLSWIMPIGYAGDVIRDLLLRGESPDLVYGSGVMAGMVLLFGALAVGGLKWRRCHG